MKGINSIYRTKEITNEIDFLIEFCNIENSNSISFSDMCYAAGVLLRADNNNDWMDSLVDDPISIELSTMLKSRSLQANKEFAELIKEKVVCHYENTIRELIKERLEVLNQKD
jgi:predicted nucleic acid-binding protein